MVQVLHGAESFDAFQSLRSSQCAPSVALDAWMAFVPYVTVAPELSAVSHAVEGARYELEAFRYADDAVPWLASGTVQTIGYALDWLHSMHHALWRAWWHWQQAGYWLTTYGDPSPHKPYQALLAEVVSHQQRLLHLGDTLRRFVARVCEEWHLAVPDELQSAWPTDDSSASGMRA